MVVYHNNLEGHSARNFDELAHPTNDAAARLSHAEDTRYTVNTFCELCMNFFFRGDRSSWETLGGPTARKPHHDTLIAFQAAAKAGCFFCRCLWSYVTNNDPPIQDGSNSSFPIFDCQLCRSQAHRFYIYFIPRKLPVSTLENFDFECKARNGQYSSDVSVAAGPEHWVVASKREEIDRFGHATASEQTWSRVKSWIRDCESNHKSCSWKLPPYYPTRLIDVSDPESPHLVEQANVFPANFYVTLSHCWGKQDFVKLEEANIAQFMDKIPLDKLPKTFLEAIDVTRRLGVRYLWIDALCIIQGSVEDWERESLTMDRVYSYALCNLAASASVDGGGGLCRIRSEIDLHGEVLTAWSNRNNAHYEVVRFDTWEHLMQEPLYRRAWVLQETHLAPRVLHFGRYQVFWQCHSNVASETFPEAEPSFDKNYTPEGNGLSEDLLHDSTLAFRYWKRAVELYSQASLTKSSDKLPAIAGIANRLMPCMGGSYYAGLFGYNLQTQLLWEVSRTARAGGTPSFRPNEYRAPSWSWASVEGRIFCSWVDGHRPSISYTQVLDIQVQPVGDKPEDVTGQLAWGYVVLQGEPFLVTALVKRNALEADKINIGMGIVYCFLDVQHESSEALEELLISVVLLIVERERLGDDKVKVSGLLLEQDETDDRQFVRIGMFRSPFPRTPDELEAWENNPSPETLALREHVKRADGGIKIV